MKNDQWLYDNVCLPALRSMYKEANPSADFDRLIKIGEAKKTGFFNNYYLEQRRQDEIAQEHIKKNKLSTFEKKKVQNELWLGSSPNGFKDVGNTDKVDTGGYKKNESTRKKNCGSRIQFVSSLPKG